MTENNDLLLDLEIVKPHRRQLLPWWMRIFCWIFMIFGAVGFICLLLGLFGLRPELAFYGFETDEPFSLIGLLIISVVVFKGITAYSLWFEKDFAIQLGKVDAIIGIILCTVSMLVPPFFQPGFNFNLRLELALLIPYLVKILRLQQTWAGRIEEYQLA